MATERPRIVTGDLWTPRFIVNRGYHAMEQRDYRDGTHLLVCYCLPDEFSDHYRYRVFGWHKPTGTNAGTVERFCPDGVLPADIGAVVRKVRQMVATRAELREMAK